MIRKNTVALILGAGTLSVANADRLGVEYAEDVGFLVTGGIRYYPESQALEDMHTLRKRRVGSSAGEVFFRSQGTLANIQASPRDDLVGVVELSSEPNVSPEDSNYVSRHYDENGELVEDYHLIGSTLRVLNLDGDMLASISDVQAYSWGPNGHQIAYITGTEYEGGFGFLSTGAWIYNVATQKTVSIYPSGYDIQWANWDGNIYIYDPFNEEFSGTPVFEFDTAMQRLTATSHRGIYFSPDGRYYFAQGYEGSSLRVFETDTEDEIDVDLLFYSPDRSQTREAFTAAGWSDEDSLIIPTPIPGDRGDYLYDVGARTMWRADGLAFPMRRPSDKVRILQGTSVVETAKTELGLLR